MSFRLNEFKLDEPKIQTPLVRLTHGEQKYDNYFTVIIGNNGTGKSRFLNRMATEYKESYEHYVEMGGMPRPMPKKLIAITTSLSDKFPPDSNTSRRVAQLDAKEFYCYLGPRGRVGGSSNRALMDKAISSLISNADEKRNFYQYNDIFDYLEYEPVLKLTYKLRVPQELKYELDTLNGERLREFIAYKSERRGGIRQGIYRRFLNYSEAYWNDLADAYVFAYREQSFRRKRDFSFLINFSEENISRTENVISSHEMSRYRVFDDLRKLDLMGSVQVKLYKKGRGEFNYTDASSGEASILSTLIGLVPNLENDSLILIDEPEISLHPSWQYRYIELIDKLLQSVTGCHVIVATHSHFLVSDLPDGRSSVVHFKDDKGNRVEVDYYDQDTNGMSAEDVLLNVFDMPSTRNYYLGRIVTELLQLLADGKKQTERYKYLSIKVQRILPNLKPVDPLYDVIVKLAKLGSADD